MDSNNRNLKFYICGITYQHELGECPVKVYNSPEDLLKDTKIAGAHDHCGVVEITINESNIKWIREQNIEGLSDQARNSNEK